MSNESALVPQAAELVRRVQSRTSPVEIIYRSHELWPLPPRSAPPPPKGSQRRSSAESQSGAVDAATTECAASNARCPPLRISDLDSSFNPPTLAHLALIRSLPPHDSNGDTTSSEAGTDNLRWGVAEDCDARLLLFVRNADKALH